MQQDYFDAQAAQIELGFGTAQAILSYVQSIFGRITVSRTFSTAQDVCQMAS